MNQFGQLVQELYQNLMTYLKQSVLLKKKKISKSKVLYGGSVNPKNINELKSINNIDGYLIGGASQDPKKFIDIIKKTYN